MLGMDLVDLKKESSELPKNYRKNTDMLGCAVSLSCV